MTADTRASASGAEPRAFVLLKSRRRLDLLNPDPHAWTDDDLAAGLWTLHYNFGHGFASEFLDAYGVPPMTDRDTERLRRRYGNPYTGKTVSTARQQYHAATDR